MNFFSRTVFSLLTIFLFSCVSHPDHTPGFGYDLMHPVSRYNLPGSLHEISGIVFYGHNKLACIQDEKGKIYIYNLKKENVKESVDFGSDHDYEGITLVDSTFYILRSTGTIFEVNHFDTDSQQTTEYNTFLKKENNTEGLCYDSLGKRLLVACKGVSHKKGKADTKEIYAFSLLDDHLDKKPVYKIHLDELEKFMHVHHIAKPVLEELKEQHSDKPNSFFEPSEIAVHPKDHSIYLLASVGKLIVVLNRDGEIKEVATLDPILFPQPEGMTFSNDGHLFISSEGRSKKREILEFEPVQPGNYKE